MTNPKVWTHNDFRMSFFRLILIVAVLVFGLYIFEKYLSPPELKDKLPLTKLIQLIPPPTSADTQPLPENQPAQTLSTSTTVSESDLGEAAVQEFQNYSQQLLKKLPKIKDLKGAKGFSVHQMPPVMMRAAADLGQVKELVSQNARLKRSAFDFYKNCAYDASLALTVRALCFKNANELHLELFREDWRYSAESVSTDVIQLAEKL